MTKKISKAAQKKGLVILLVLALIFGAFTYGLLVGVYEYFPYDYLERIHESYKRNALKQEFLGRDTGNKGTTDFEWSYDLNEGSIDLSFDGALNNFDVYRTNIEEFANEKLAYMGVKDSLIEAHPQINFSLIRDSGVNEEDFVASIGLEGGLKNIFYYKDQLLALVGLFDEPNDCAYASLVNISINKTIIRFPCLPQSNSINLNNVGGGFVPLENEKKLLLAVGTPEVDFGDIQNLAQDDTSPYGKILEIEEDTLYGKSDNYEIFSKGHRNPQSMLKLGETIIAVEHGPRGGDEVNLIKKGMNYGWPETSLGSQYDLAYISKSNVLAGNEISSGLLFAFLPAIAISFIDNCPTSYRVYYEPNKCVIVGSLRAGTLFFLQIDPSLSKVLAVEAYEVGSRLRKVIVSDDLLIIGTDFEGIVLLKIELME